MNENLVPNDEDLVAVTTAILKQCDLETTTLKSLRQKLEDTFKCGDLRSKKDLIRETLEIFIGLGEEEEVFEEEQIATVDTKKTGERGGFGKAVQLSDELAEFMQHDILPRTQITKKIWEYIKANDLQNPADKREILCDAKLEKLFKRKSVNMFKMTKYLSAMMKSTDDLNDGPKDETKAGSKRKIEKQAMKVKQKVKIKRTTVKKDYEEPRKTALHREKAISADLAKVISCGIVDSRTNVVKQLWAYIREKDLQNPQDRREIVLDKALKDVFKLNTFTAFSMHKYLSDHISDLES